MEKRITLMDNLMFSAFCDVRERLSHGLFAKTKANVSPYRRIVVPLRETNCARGLGSLLARRMGALTSGYGTFNTVGGYWGSVGIGRKILGLDACGRSCKYGLPPADIACEHWRLLFDRFDKRVGKRRKHRPRRLEALLDCWFLRRFHHVFHVLQ